MPRWLGGGGTIPKLNFLGSAGPVAGITQFIFLGVNFGAPVPGRVIVIGAASQAFGAFSSVTIGGIAATLISGGTGDLWYAVVPLGSSGTVVLNSATNFGNAAIAVYSMSGLNSATPQTTDSATAVGSAAFNRNLNIPANGICIAIVGAGAVMTEAWTGLSKDMDTNFGFSIVFSMASLLASSALTPLNITVTPSAAGGRHFVAGVWR